MALRLRNIGFLKDGMSTSETCLIPEPMSQNKVKYQTVWRLQQDHSNLHGAHEY